MLKTYQKLVLKPKIRTLVSYVSHYSTKPVPKEAPDPEKQLQEFQRISNIQQKTRTRQPQKPPFVKNLLLGVFDTDILSYPELSNEDLNALNKNVEPVQTFLQQPEIKESSQLTKDFLRKMAKERLLGLQATQLMGGRELTATEMCRFLESISELKLKNELINNEVLGIQTLLKFGSDKLKRKYLQRLIDGESVSAFCVLEPLESNVDLGKRTGIKGSDGKTWVLNGEKKLITNGSNADLYVVVANTQNVLKHETKEQKFTIFLVERDFGGITSSKHDTKDGLELSDVVFENVVVPDENIIGGEDTGDKILKEIYPQYRLSIGPMCSVLIKNLINKLTEHFINVSRRPHLLYETDAVCSRLGELTTSLYAIDSMVYLTSSLIDNYENQDTELETSIVKVFVSGQAFHSTSLCQDLIGPESVLGTHWCSQLHAEASSHVALNDSNDNLKILIALFGLSYAGEKINEVIKKVRNPLFYSTFVLKRMWTTRRQVNDNPKLDLYLHHFLHPSSSPAAERLEYCVKRLQFATEMLLARYGNEVINKHSELRRLADAIIDIYAMTACIGRASRSYCIGLRHADYEMTLAAAFTFAATERVKANLSKVIDGPYMTNDENYRMIAKRLFELKHYYPVHPLSRNF